MSRKFEYRGDDRTIDEQRAAAASSGYDSIFRSDVKMFKPREGENCIRVLPDSWSWTVNEKDQIANSALAESWPFPKDLKFWSCTVFLHRNVGPEGGTYLCLEKMKGEPCPIEAAIKEARDNDDEDTADSLRRQEGRVVWLIDRDHEKEGPMVWLMPKKKVYDEIVMRSERDKKTNKPLKIDRPDDGYDITFNRVGTGQRTDYKGIEIARDPSPIHDDVKIQDRWLDYITDNALPNVLNYYGYEHIEKVLSGGMRRKPEDKDEGRSRRDRSRSQDTDREPERSERERTVERPRTRTHAEPENERTERATERTSERTAAADEKPWDDADKEMADTADSPSAQARARLERLRESRARR